MHIINIKIKENRYLGQAIQLTATFIKRVHRNARTCGGAWGKMLSKVLGRFTGEIDQNSTSFETKYSRGGCLPGGGVIILHDPPTTPNFDSVSLILRFLRCLRYATSFPRQNWGLFVQKIKHFCVSGAPDFVQEDWSVD